MNLPHSDELEIQHLSRLFDSTSERYKFFWFQAIVTKAISGKRDISYEELIDEMIADKLYLPTDMSIDHFVPWSYVAHDELWNPHPTTKSINSSKSNCLPDWDIYFPELAKLEYLSYQMMWVCGAQ